MNCQEFLSIARDYTRQEWLHSTSREMARQHLSHCQACRLHLDNEQDLTAALACVAVEGNRVQAPASVEASVLAAFRARQTVRATRRIHPLWWAIPAAAALLIAAFALRPAPRNPSAPPLATIPAPQFAISEDPAPPAARESRDTPSIPPQPARAPRPPALRYARGNPESVTEFIPLRYGKPIESGEPIQVLRIQLPRAELLRLGLPVAPDGAAATIKADVLLGEDGLAKAIRFVY